MKKLFVLMIALIAITLTSCGNLSKTKTLEITPDTTSKVIPIIDTTKTNVIIVDTTQIDTINK